MLFTSSLLGLSFYSIPWDGISGVMAFSIRIILGGLEPCGYPPIFAGMFRLVIALHMMSDKYLNGPTGQYMYI